MQSVVLITTWELTTGTLSTRKSKLTEMLERALTVVKLLAVMMAVLNAKESTLEQFQLRYGLYAQILSRSIEEWV